LICSQVTILEVNYHIMLGNTRDLFLYL
jgi:hypothetical protein